MYPGRISDKRVVAVVVILLLALFLLLLVLKDPFLHEDFRLSSVLCERNDSEKFRRILVI